MGFGKNCFISSFALPSWGSDSRAVLRAARKSLPSGTSLLRPAFGKSLTYSRSSRDRTARRVSESRRVETARRRLQRLLPPHHHQQPFPLQTIALARPQNSDERIARLL